MAGELKAGQQIYVRSKGVQKDVLQKMQQMNLTAEQDPANSPHSGKVTFVDNSGVSVYITRKGGAIRGFMNRNVFDAYFKCNGGVDAAWGKETEHAKARFPDDFLR